MLHSRKNTCTHYLFVYSFYYQDLCKPTKLLEADTVSLKLPYILLWSQEIETKITEKQEFIKDCSFIFINMKARATVLQKNRDLLSCTIQ